jgi:type VI secretion system protein ImpE
MADASLKERLAAVMAATRAAPTDASLRMQLFRLLVITGQWDRAVNQLDTATRLDSSLGFTGTVYGQAIACERLRADVFAGKRTPLVAGEPAPWLALLFEALRGGDSAKANALRSEALEAAPAAGGSLDGRPFTWIADADSRLGPVIEAFLDGNYYWVPVDRLAALRLPAPDDVLDVVWAPAELEFVGGGTRHAMLPVRYAGTESRDDDSLREARATQWEGDDETGWRGLGQRVLATDAEECGLLDVRSLTLAGPPAPGAAPS